MTTRHLWISFTAIHTRPYGGGGGGGGGGGDHTPLIHCSHASHSFQDFSSLVFVVLLFPSAGNIPAIAALFATESYD